MKMNEEKKKDLLEKCCMHSGSDSESFGHSKSGGRMLLGHSIGSLSDFFPKLI
jgi:hypothetical protein